MGGGTWTRIGLSLTPSCACPTGQGTCPCALKNDCLSQCVTDDLQSDCGGVCAGTCAAWSQVAGCHCAFYENGGVGGICWG